MTLEYSNSSFYQYRVNGIPCDIDIDQWLEEGWIKEVEEKEYTYSDMKRCGEFWAGGPITKEHFDQYLYDLKQRE
ncbi:MAG: hypothetical protein IIC75_00285 [Bacteroidetes bacterium]|nr:hypothetical protein [Bacteroidota bacterium]